VADDREIRLYYFTLMEAAELAHCGMVFAKAQAGAAGAIEWHDGEREQLMFPPESIGKLKQLHERRHIHA
jgi:hypothetical protein